MSRILLLDNDAAARMHLRDGLAGEGHEVLEATTPDEALGYASAGTVDLVILDTREASIRASIPPGLPFIFVSAGEADERDMLSELASEEYLFLKPPDVAELNRTIGALVGAMTRDEGSFNEPGSFDRLLEGIAKQGESGVLTAYQASVTKKIVFNAGQIAFCGSNDPKDFIGQSLIKAGLITEADLKEAIDAQANDTAPLGQILQALGKVTNEQLEQAVKRKFSDTVLGMYLWDDGKWVFVSGGVSPSDAPHPVQLEIAPLRLEGKRRSARWRELRRVLPNDDSHFKVHPDKFPAGFPKNAGDKRLIQLAGSGRTLGQIRLELRGQDFAIFSRYAEFIKHGVVTIGTAASPPDHTPPPRQPVAGLLRMAETALVSGNTEAAKKAFQEVLKADPTNVVARRGLDEVGVMVKHNAVASGLSAEAVVRLTVAPQELDLQTIQPAEAFIVSRLSGGTATVRELIQISPLAENEVLQVLHGLMNRGIVAT